MTISRTDLMHQKKTSPHANERWNWSIGWIWWLRWNHDSVSQSDGITSGAACAAIEYEELRFVCFLFVADGWLWEDGRGGERPENTWVLPRSFQNLWLGKSWYWALSHIEVKLQTNDAVLILSIWKAPLELMWWRRFLLNWEDQQTRQPWTVC